MKEYCRFEILLPLAFNDGQPVPREFLADTAAEIQAKFGGVSWESQAIEGIWHTGGIQYRIGSTEYSWMPKIQSRIANFSRRLNLV
jgi:hypothetical protein